MNMSNQAIKKCFTFQDTVLNVDLNQINGSGIETKLCNIRNVTKILIEKAKWVEERRKYLETVNWYLKNENADLLERYESRIYSIIIFFTCTVSNLFLSISFGSLQLSILLTCHFQLS